MMPVKTGNRYLFANASGVIRFSLKGPATSTDLAIE